MSVQKKYTAEEKAKVAMEALRGNMSMSEISSKFQVHSTQITRWKVIAKDALIAGFKSPGKKDFQDNELIEELYKQIGQLKVELEWLKKNLPHSLGYKKMLVEKEMYSISLNRQLYLLGINKSSYYYHKQPRLISAEDLHLMNLVDKIYTSFPIFGTRKMCEYLYNEHEMQVNRDKMRGIYDKLQIRAIHQEPKGTVANKA
jgi:putative transposase